MDPLHGEGVRAILLDIEGTTTPVKFVSGVLFPYARARVGDYMARHGEEPAVREDLARLREEQAADERAGSSPPPWRDTLDSAVGYVQFLMDRDRKSTGLKSLQGRIWEEGYRSGALQGEVFPDVPTAFERWRRQGRDIAIFSSGSVLAQKLLFASTPAGNLTPYIRAYFDTTTGPKQKAQSYRRIARALDIESREVLFLSDVVAELGAARKASMGTALCVRSGEAVAAPPHAVVYTLDGVCP